MSRKLVISDIHGCFDEFIVLLEKSGFNPKKDELIILGDMIDRGKKSKQVVEHIMALVENHGAIALGGNHEDEFLDWVNRPYQANHRFLRIGGKRTIESYCKAHGVYGKGSKTLHTFHRFYSNHIRFIKNLPDFYEDENHIFVHAGINLTLDKWQETSKEQMRSIRDDFIQGKNNTGKVVVFGHTPTSFLHDSKDAENTDVWFSPDNKIGIDGGCSMGGKLHCLSIEKGRYRVFSVNKKQ